MNKIQHAKYIIPKNLIIGETCFTTFSITFGSRGKHTHASQSQWVFIYLILTSKLNSYGDDVQLYFYVDSQQEVHTISSRNCTIISGVFNKTPNQSTS